MQFLPKSYYVMGFWAAVLLLVFYLPPRTAAGLRDLIERHFGDAIALYILHLGVALVILGGLYTPVVPLGLVGIGNSMIMASMIALKLKLVPGANGGSGSTVTTSQTIESKATTATPMVPAVAAAVPGTMVPATPEPPKGSGA